jgi:hypothetical protein
MDSIIDEIMAERKEVMAYNRGLKKAVYVLEESLIRPASDRLRLLEALEQEIKDSETDFTSRMLQVQLREQG